MKMGLEEAHIIGGRKYDCQQSSRSYVTNVNRVQILKYNHLMNIYTQPMSVHSENGYQFSSEWNSLSEFPLHNLSSY